MTQLKFGCSHWITLTSISSDMPMSKVLKYSIPPRIPERLSRACIANWKKISGATNEKKRHNLQAHLHEFNDFRETTERSATT